jgi:cytochrome bd-type quinol oxidase subunit 2
MHGDAIGRPANGSGAAAILAAAIGCFVLGILALVEDAYPGAAKVLNFWNPTGPLSGVTDVTIVAWLASWWLLTRRWSGRDIALRRVNAIATLLFLSGFLLTFPPFMDMLQGK